MSMPPIKKIVLWLIVIFLLYAILTSPSDAADIVDSAWDVVRNGVQNIFDFFDALLRRN
jgi:cell shape-determining protein MreC